METSSRPADAGSTLRRFVRRAFFVFVILVTLIALFYAEENFRAKYTWNRYRKNAAARGVQLDFAALIPPPIPDEQNGASTPLIQNWFPKPKADDSDRWPELFSQASAQRQTPKWQQTQSANVAQPNPFNQQDNRRPTDFVSWQKAFAAAHLDPKPKKQRTEEDSATEPTREEQVKAARAVLEELKIYEPALAELRAASRRPKVRYPVDYNVDDPFTILLPHLPKIKGIAQELKLQASAELATGQTDRAFENLRLLLWFTESLENEGFLIGQLVRIACQQIATQPIWEGMLTHQWSEPQLKEIQDRMLRVNFAESMNYAMTAERAAGVAFIQHAIKQNNLGELLSVVGTPEDPSALEEFLTDPTNQKMMGWLAPRGWLYFEMMNHGSMLDGLIADGWDPARRVFHSRTLDANEKAFIEEIKTLRSRIDAILRHRALAQLLIPALTKASTKCARAQSTANQVALACALERYHKARGSYPESLAALVPNYLASIPNDALSTNAMRYTRVGDGYVLYSLGWDGVDDGGALLTGRGYESQKGDWVWRVEK